MFVVFVAAAALHLAADHAPISDHRIRLAEAWLETQLDHALVPGAVLTLTAPGHAPLVRGFGVASADEDRNAAGTAFRVCSISKLFTALTIASLAEEGQLSLDAPLAQDFNFQGTPQQVTLRQLLLHTSGLREEASAPYFVEFNFPGRDELRSDEASVRLLAPPGRQYRYSNLGYALAAMAAESLTGKSFEELLTSQVSTPLRLTGTYHDVHDPAAASSVSGYTVRASGRDRVQFEPYSFNALAPAGGLITTGHDLAALSLWMGTALSDPASATPGPVTPGILAELAARPPDGSVEQRGVGLNFYESPSGVDFVGHGGYCSGYRAILLVEPRSGRGVSLTLDVNDESPAQLAYATYDLVFAAQPQDADQINRGRTDTLAFEGVYDRAGMPERYAVVAAGKGRLELVSLFSRMPESTLEILTPHDHGVFTRGDGSEVRFQPDETGQMRLWVHPFHYLVRRKSGHSERRPKPVVDQAVKFRCLERVSTPPEPRVMGRCSVGHWVEH